MSHYQNQDSFYTPDKHFMCVIETPKLLPNGKFLLTCFSDYIPDKEFIPITYGSWSEETQECWHKIAMSLYNYLNETDNG